MVKRKKDLDLLRRIGRKIRDVRADKGLSQEDLAHKARIDRTYMSGIERGLRNLTVQVLRDIARALGVPMRALLGED